MNRTAPIPAEPPSTHSIVHDHGKPLVVDWMDSEWFSVWLKIARHEPIEAAA